MKKLLCILGFSAVLFMTAAPVMAATEWNFAASLRFATWWTDIDGGKEKINDLEGGGAKLNKDATLEFLQQRNSRIKMLMKSDNLEGYIEMGWNTATGTVTPRDYFGTYRFTDEFSITMGQHLQLFDTTGFSNQAWGNDLNMHGIGVSWNPSDPKMFFTFRGFQFGLSIPYHTEGKLSGATSSTGTYSADKDTFMPQLQFAYQYRADTWRIKVGGGFQNYKMKNFTHAATNNLLFKSKNVNSWLLMFDGNINLGPLYLAATASVGQNWAEACWNTRKGGLANEYTNNKRLDTFGVALKGDKLKNTTSVMGAVVVGYNITEVLRLEGGFGYRYDENDAWDKNSHMWTTYIQAAYTVAPGFRIIPEIGYVDLGDTVGTRGARDSKDNGYIWYAGAKWQMDF